MRFRELQRIVEIATDGFESRRGYHLSPCIDICKFIAPNGWCLGCARTRDEARKWKKLKPYDIKIMHKTLQRRMEIINNSS